MKKKTMIDGKMKKEIKVYIFNIKIKRRGFVLIINWCLYLFFFSVYWGVSFIKNDQINAEAILYYSAFIISL